MIFVQALEDGAISQAGRRFLLQSLEEGRWAIDREGIDVDPGLVVSFSNLEDRDHFLQYIKNKPPRAQVPVLSTGEVLIFKFEDDVAALESQGLIRRLSPEEIEQVLAQLASNKPVEVDVPESAQDAPAAETPRARGGKKRSVN